MGTSKIYLGLLSQVKHRARTRTSIIPMSTHWVSPLLSLQRLCHGPWNWDWGGGGVFATSKPYICQSQSAFYCFQLTLQVVGHCHFQCLSTQMCIGGSETPSTCVTSNIRPHSLPHQHKPKSIHWHRLFCHLTSLSLNTCSKSTGVLSQTYIICDLHLMGLWVTL